MDLSIITAEQCKAARALAGLSQQRLAAAANVSLATVQEFEAGRRRPVANNMAAIIRALTDAGVIFIEENGGGPGVRLRKRPASE